MTENTQELNQPQSGDQSPPAPPRAGGAVSACPYLGRLGDPDTHFVQASVEHRCHATDPAGRIRVEHQSGFCYSDFVACPTFLPLDELGERAQPVAIAAGASGAGSEAGGGGAEAAGASSAAARAAAGAGGNGGGFGSSIINRAKSFSFEEWTVYIVTALLLLAIAWFGIFRDGSSEASTRPQEPGIQARAEELAYTETPTPLPKDTSTPRPTKPTQVVAIPTLVLPTPAEGGLMAALSPSERGVGSFNDADKLPAYGERNLHVGRFDGRDYVGGVLIPLSKIPEGSRINYVALELTGLSDSNLHDDATWTVQMLDPPTAEEWRNLTYETIKGAPATQLRSGWQIADDDVAPRKVNVLEFSDDARDTFIQRLEQGRVAFRITAETSPDGGDSADDAGTEGGDLDDAGGDTATDEELPDNLFTWDTGYGEGFGARPVLRVGFVPPPPTAGPAPGKPTQVPLIVWVSDPTPAPTSTALPGSAPSSLKGMILFLSDRFGKIRLMVYDPASERIGQVTKTWPYEVEKARQLAGGGISVGVVGRTCGSGATPVANDDNEVIVPGDPVRECTQLEVTSPDAAVPQEVSEPGHLNYEPAVSPDGQWIAYVTTLTGTDELFKVRRNGTDNTRLTENVWAWDKHPSWSPDGEQIVFWSNRDGVKQLYIMNTDGSGVRNISNNPYNDFDPVWVR